MWKHFFFPIKDVTVNVDLIVYTLKTCQSASIDRFQVDNRNA